jgi:hypothetical protein
VASVSLPARQAAHRGGQQLGSRSILAFGEKPCQSRPFAGSHLERNAFKVHCYALTLNSSFGLSIARIGVFDFKPLDFIYLGQFVAQFRRFCLLARQMLLSDVTKRPQTLDVYSLRFCVPLHWPARLPGRHLASPFLTSPTFSPLELGPGNGAIFLMDVRLSSFSFRGAKRRATCCGWQRIYRQAKNRFLPLGRNDSLLSSWNDTLWLVDTWLAFRTATAHHSRAEASRCRRVRRRSPSPPAA